MNKTSYNIKSAYDKYKKINKVNIIIRSNIIDNGDVPLEKIWFVTKVNQYKKD